MNLDVHSSEWRRLRLRVLYRDRFVCHYCHGRANSVDHVVPRYDGGPDHEWNLVACCVSCNSRRSREAQNRRRKIRTAFFSRREGRATTSLGLRPRRAPRGVLAAIGTDSLR